MRRMSDDGERRRHPPFLGRLWQHHAPQAVTRLETALFGQAAVDLEPAAPGDAARAWREPADALAWLVRTTASSGAAYVYLEADGYMRSEVAPAGLDDGSRAGLVDRARELFVSGVLGSHAGDGESAVTWYARGALHAVLAAGVRSGGDPALQRVRRFLDERAVRGDAPPSDAAEPAGDPSPPRERPRLLDVAIEELGDVVRVTTSLEWRGRAMTGSATGTPTDEGRHRAAARAIVRAMQPAIGPPLRLDRFRLISAGSVRLAVAAVRLDGRLLTGAAAAGADGPAAGARAALAALNRELTRP
jgi:hypothetical protein